MGKLAGVLGKVIVAVVLLALAGGIFLAFVTMGPQRQAPVALAPTPTATPQGQKPSGPLPTPTPIPPTATPQGQKPAGPLPTATSIPENTPIHIRNVGLVFLHPNYIGATSASESAIIGVVKRKLPARWNTVDGKRPPIYWGLPSSQRDRYGIFTPFVVEVERYIYNPQAERDLMVAMVGGQVGVDSQDAGAGDSPILDVGERVLAFVSRFPDVAIRDSALVEGKPFWIPEFKHEITTEGRARNRWVDLPLDDVIQRIEAAAAQKR